MSLADDFRLTNLPLALKAKVHVRIATVEEQLPRTEIEVGPICHCRSFRTAHFLDAHKQLSDEWDWRTPEEREE